ncbi:MAG: hypothetical protein KF841_10180 [Phycisphaerae bacterium]|nr:hypothetical protein [Phycisphaerae bacterium]
MTPDSKLSGIVIGFVLICGADFAFANRAGALPFRNGGTASNGNNCSACHAGSLGHSTGSVQILDAPVMYNFNRVYDITIMVTDTVQAGAGFEFSAESPLGAFLGTPIVSDAVNTRHSSGTGGTNFITHTATGVGNAVANWASLGNTAFYHVQWRAPDSDMGQVNFFAAGNAINNNFANSLDRVYLTSVSTMPATCDKADLTGDSAIDGQDLALFVATWLDPDNATPREFCAGDMNDDGMIDDLDAAALVEELLSQ